MKKISELLAMHVLIMDERRRRKIIGTEHNPTSDLAEYLFCRAFGWKQEANSEKPFDAIDVVGMRCHIKARRINHLNRPRHLSAIRDLDGFYFLAEILIDHHYNITRAALVSSAVVAKFANWHAHTNSHRFLLRDQVWEHPEVEDVTERLTCLEF